jgi:hypothetical protein
MPDLHDRSPPTHADPDIAAGLRGPRHRPTGTKLSISEMHEWRTYCDMQEPPVTPANQLRKWILVALSERT